MKQSTATRLVFLLAFTVVIIAFSAFRQKENGTSDSFRESYSPSKHDTTKSRKRPSIIDNGELEKLDAAMLRLDKQMVALDEKIKKMDFSKVQNDIDKALKNIDVDKINNEVNAAIKKIDWTKINAEIDKTAEELKKIDMAKVKQQIENAKLQIDRQKINIDSKKIKADVEKAMENARESLLKAKDELSQLKAFTNELEKDGLINKSKRYKIEVKDNELYINGEKQPKEVNDKYKKYFRKGNYTINSNEENEGVVI